MFFFWGALLAAGASYLAADKSSKNQGKFNAKEAEKNRLFQEDMSNTAFQRAAADLEAAGLNRVLALGSPASTPGGSSASIDAPNLAGAVSTGIAAASAKQQIDLSKAEEALLREKRNESLESQALMKEQANQSMTQAQLNRASARLSNARATKEERYNPLHDVVGDTLQSGVDYVRSNAKDDLKSAFDFLNNSAKKAAESTGKTAAEAQQAVERWFNDLKRKYRKN